MEAAVKPKMRTVDMAYIAMFSVVMEEQLGSAFAGG